MVIRRGPSLSVTAADLRERAAEFRRLAEASQDEVIYRELLRLADIYFYEADALERGSGGTSDTPDPSLIWLPLSTEIDALCVEL